MYDCNSIKCFLPSGTDLFMLVLTISEQFKIELVSYSSVVKSL